MKTFFTFLFYVAAIIPIMYEISCMMKPAKAHNFIQNLKKVKLSDYDKLDEVQKLFGSLNMLYTIWVLVGLFTSQWILFLFLILISVVPKVNVSMRFMDSLLSLLTLMFIIINKYQLHINLYEAAKGLLGIV